GSSPGSGDCSVALGLSVLVSSLSSGAPPCSAPDGLARREGRMVPEVRVLSSVLGLALLCFPLDSHARARPDMFCLFHGKRYSPGESWHPYLEPQGLMYCLRCTCSESARVSCYRLHCPPVHCPEPVTEPQQCCPRCVEPHTPSGLRALPKSCQHNGTMYQHGEIFSAHELLPSHLPNQCVLCSCSVRPSTFLLAQACGLGLQSPVDEPKVPPTMPSNVLGLCSRPGQKGIDFHRKSPRTGL
ncbi:hypothetical protein MC885_006042, partial [Smutsia gigantea]